MADPLDLQEFAIDLVAEIAQVREIRHRLGDIEIVRVVDGGLGAQGALLLEVLLDVRGLVLDMETRLDPVGDHPRAIAPRRRRGRPGDPQRKEEPDAIGGPEVQILANDRFEEVAALHGTREDLRQTDFDLLEREAVRVAGGVIRGAHGRREPGDPPIEERLHVGGPERIADRLHPHRIRTGEKSVIETLEADGRTPELLFDPLMAVETQLDGIRQIGPKLQERRPPFGGPGRRSSSD